MIGKNPLDPLSVAQLIAGVVLSPALASIVGPYSMIFIAAIGGAAASLADDKSITTRKSAFLFFLRGISVAMLWTVPAATWLASYMHWDTDWILLIVAAILSYAAGKWRQIIRFFIGLGKAWILSWVKRDGK